MDANVGLAKVYREMDANVGLCQKMGVIAPLHQQISHPLQLTWEQKQKKEERDVRM